MGRGAKKAKDGEWVGGQKILGRSILKTLKKVFPEVSTWNNIFFYFYI
jgi:hypothetical protein